MSFEKTSQKVILTAVAVLSLGTMALAGLVVPALSHADYDPGYVMSNDVFSNYGSMSAEQIQAFLVARGSFLQSYTVPTNTVVGPNGETISAGTRAANVIAAAANWYHVNPQVIITTIQKEWGAILTTSTPADGSMVIDCAMGYDGGLNCPQVFATYPGRRGFVPQVIYGTWQLEHDFQCAAPGVSSWDGYGCSGYDRGSVLQGVTIETEAGAALLCYTPNIATYGPGYSFRTNFINWFGNLLDWVNPGTPVYRFYKNDGTHFYTASESEKNNIVTKWPNVYKLEGISYYINMGNPVNNTSLYRFYNVQNGTHFYTASESEKNNILQRWGYIYQLDGVAYNVSTASGTPVYRFYCSDGTHFYTASESEKNNIISKWPGTYKYEGVAFYIN